MSPTVSLQLLQSFGPLVIAVTVALIVLAFQLYRGRSGGLLALRLGAVALLVLLLLVPVLAFFSEHTGPPPQQPCPGRPSACRPVRLCEPSRHRRFRGRCGRRRCAWSSSWHPP